VGGVGAVFAGECALSEYRSASAEPDDGHDE